MPINSAGEGALGTGRVGTGEMPGTDRTLGFALSVGLHGLVVLLLIFAAQSGIATSRHGLQWVPIDVEVGPPKPRRPAATPARDVRAPTASSESSLRVPPAEAKQAIGVTPGELEALAKLRQSDYDSDLPAQQATNDVPIPGDDLTVNAAKDFIRAEVERRWNFDLKKFGDGGYSVPIHVRITSAGTVLSAEILDNERSADPIYREIALSARSAVLLSSPFALPAGHYQDVMDMVLDLDPRETLR